MPSAPQGQESRQDSRQPRVAAQLFLKKTGARTRSQEKFRTPQRHVSAAVTERALAILVSARIDRSRIPWLVDDRRHHCNFNDELIGVELRELSPEKRRMQPETATPRCAPTGSVRRSELFFHNRKRIHTFDAGIASLRSSCAKSSAEPRSGRSQHAGMQSMLQPMASRRATFEKTPALSQTMQKNRRDNADGWARVSSSIPSTFRSHVGRAAQPVSHRTYCD